VVRSELSGIGGYKRHNRPALDPEYLLSTVQRASRVRYPAGGVITLKTGMGF
jgi:hypothetical protein